MSTIKSHLQEDIISAMKAKDASRLAVLRFLSSKIKQYEVDERKEADETQVLSILDKVAKQHRYSI